MVFHRVAWAYRRNLVAVPLLALVFSAGPGSAQPAPQVTATPGAEPVRTGLVATAGRLNGTPIVVDGELNDEAWRGVQPVSEFVQTEPLEGQPATEKTEVRVLYDPQALYVGVICFDNDPSAIVTTDARRDSSLGEMDSFQMILDTYHDRQNGFIFGTNAAGLQYDAQVRNEGDNSQTGTAGPPQIGRVAGGAGGGVNANWDASWEVKARVSDVGWSAEFRIPLRSLRYGRPPQVWGLNFSRLIQHKREQVYWAPLSRIYNLTRLSSAGELHGLDLETPRNLQVTPYVVGTSDRTFSPGAENELDGDWGLDGKIGITPSMNLDLSYNTDFAQVEVDEQQINLTRFNLLFPEKRPFFLENAGLFAVGRSGEVDLFFSRRIGITDNGTPVPILGGARLTGKTAGMNIGILNMQTKSGGRDPANNFTAARVNRELPNRSNVGALFVNRTATGDRAGADNWNRTWALDSTVGYREHVTFRGFAARTETPGLTGAEHSVGVGGEFRDREKQAYLEYTEVAENFNPEVGFLERTDAYRKLWTGYHRFVRTAGLTKLGVREITPHVNYESFWGFDGFQETAQAHLHNMFAFERGHRISTEFNIQEEGLRVPFEVYPGVIVPADTYNNPWFGWSASSDGRRAVSGGLSQNIGGFLSGHQNIIAPQVTIREQERLIMNLRWNRSDITLPEGHFVTNLGSLRVTYNFSTSIFAQTLIQYNDRTSRWSTNLRFNWLQTAATGLYLVYNDLESLNGFGPVNRAFIVKFSRQFDLH